MQELRRPRSQRRRVAGRERRSLLPDAKIQAADTADPVTFGHARVPVGSAKAMGGRRCGYGRAQRRTLAARTGTERQSSRLTRLFPRDADKPCFADGAFPVRSACDGGISAKNGVDVDVKKGLRRYFKPAECTRRMTRFCMVDIAVDKRMKGPSGVG